TEETDATFVECCLALFGDDFAFEATDDDCDFSAWPSVTVCAANPVRQLEAVDGEALDAWRAICSGTTIDKLAQLPGDMPRHLRSPAEMATQFRKHPEWLENTVKLAERIETFDLDRPPAIRAFPIPEGFADTSDYLRRRVLEGAKARWGDPLPKDVVARLDYELSVIGRRQMAGCDAISYLLIVADYVEAARRMGVAVGPGRGGAGGCAVAYALGITDVDPMKHGLLFERFLNPDRENLPDIDIDFDEEGVAKVLEYLVGKYGEDRVARIATFTVTARKSGYVRSVGTHACGIVISPEAMTNFAPVMRLDGGPIHLVTQYGGWHIEEVGLVEFDILGLKTLSDQKRCLELVSAKTGEGIDLSAIPEDDGKMLALFARGNTEGIFQFDGDGIREVLRKLKPSRFSDIAALNALFHPGMMDLLPAFIRRKNGEEPVSYDHPLMVDVLEETYGMLVYQEQVMLLAQRLAGFTPGESDGLRKAFGKKLRQRVGEYRDKFVAGCLANPEFRIEGWRDEAAARTLAEKVFSDCGRVALYAFCRAHVLCYALLAYRSAYLKAHWPEEFGKVLRNNCALRP
ncbi:MAG: DNA polymerase III subunit alpha, partial [Kiritimatiellae bacterium]|nr:DNA polymerase III subunit alpha [Kiritimatiellia bacterium]